MAFAAGERQVIEQFAQQLDLPAKPARDGSYGFIFATSGTLTLTPSRDGERTVMGLARHPGRLAREMLQRALSRAGYDATQRRLLAVGLLADGSLVFSVSIDRADLSLPTLESCLQDLLTQQRALP